MQHRSSAMAVNAGQSLQKYRRDWRQQKCAYTGGRWEYHELDRTCKYRGSLKENVTKMHVHIKNQNEAAEIPRNEERWHGGCDTHMTYWWEEIHRKTARNLANELVEMCGRNNKKTNIVKRVEGCGGSWMCTALRRN